MNDPAVLLQNAVFQYLVSTKQFGSASELYKGAHLDRFYPIPLADLLQVTQWNESNNLLISIWNNYLATHHADIQPQNQNLIPIPAPISTTTVPAPISIPSPTPVPIPLSQASTPVPLPTPPLLDSPTITSSPPIASTSSPSSHRFPYKPHYHPHPHSHSHTHHSHSPAHHHHHHSHTHGHGVDQHQKRIYTHNHSNSPQSSPDMLNNTVNNLSLNTQPTTIQLNTVATTTTASSDVVANDVMTFTATPDNVNMLPASTTETFFQLASSPGTLSSALQSISPISVTSMMPDVSPSNLVDSIMQDQPIGTPPDDGVGRFPCNYPGCNKSFSTSAILKRHIKEHSGERPFSCSVEGCTKRFARKYDLKVHMRSHTGEKPYSCTFPGCERKFSRSSDLRLHERIHKGDKPFICDCEGCKKRFVRYADLKKHKRTHEVHEGSHPHKHGAGCGHTAIAHEDHIDYLHDNHLHNNHHDHIDDHTIAVTSSNPDGCKPTFVCGHHQHDESCGHELVPHFDHFDFLVDGRLHYVHDSHCDDHGWIDVIDWNPLPEDKSGTVREGDVMVHANDSS